MRMQQPYHILDLRNTILERQNFALLEALGTVCGWPGLASPPSMSYAPTYPCHYGLQPQLLDTTGSSAHSSFPRTSTPPALQKHLPNSPTCGCIHCSTYMNGA